MTEIKEYQEIVGNELQLVPIRVGEKVLLNNIFFEYAKATLRKDSYPELDRIAESLKENPSLSIEIQGHTDNVGSIETNQKLSEERAGAVKTYLLSKKIPSSRVTSIGFGETKPISSNDTDEGKAKNRRVEFLILNK